MDNDQLPRQAHVQETGDGVEGDVGVMWKGPRGKAMKARSQCGSSWGLVEQLWNCKKVYWMETRR